MPSLVSPVGRRRSSTGARANPFEAPGLTPARAALLGLVQGPAELLPVSSSAHLSLLPWFADWRLDEVDAEARKGFDVALHAGTAVALLIAQRRLIASGLGAFDRRRAVVLGLSLVPPAIAGYGLERVIEARLGGPRATAAGLVAGAVALAVADRLPQDRGPGDAGGLDGLALGIGQAAALAPGVSRSGGALAAARMRRFSRPQAQLLSRATALPVIAGATALKGSRLRRRGIDRSLRKVMAAGVAASFASTLAAQKLVDLTGRDRPLWPYAAYRAALAGAVAMRLSLAARRRHAARSG